jgi:ParB-like nuclease domain
MPQQKTEPNHELRAVPTAEKPAPENQMTLRAMAKHIELWPVDKLIPFARNPRTHSETQIAQIAASIDEFGFNNPILVDTRAGIIAGHGRLRAARKLGMKEVPVIVLDHLSDAQKRAYIIADNQLALNAGWDEEILGVELAALQAEDFDIGLIGFEDVDLERLLAANDAGGLTDEDAVPDPPEDPVTRTGDLWLLGPHRVLCGDATCAEAVSRVCGAPRSGAQPFLMITDPPYGISLDSEWRDRAGLNGCGPAEASYMEAPRRRPHRDEDIRGHPRRLVGSIRTAAQPPGGLRVAREHVHPGGAGRAAADWIPASSADHLE